MGATWAASDRLGRSHAWLISPDEIGRPMSLCRRIWSDAVAEFAHATDSGRHCSACEQALAVNPQLQKEKPPEQHRAKQPTPPQHKDSPMPLITVNASAPEIEPGTYEVTLTAIEPKTIIAKTGPEAGSEIEILEWKFALEDETEVKGSTSTSSGPKSKMYGFLTALLGGQAPATGTSFEVGDLVGRMCLAKVVVSESGWPRVEQLTALPRATARPAAKATTRPVAQPF